MACLPQRVIKSQPSLPPCRPGARKKLWSCSTPRNGWAWGPSLPNCLCLFPGTPVSREGSPGLVWQHAGNPKRGCTLAVTGAQNLPSGPDLGHGGLPRGTTQQAAGRSGAAGLIRPFHACMHSRGSLACASLPAPPPPALRSGSVACRVSLNQASATRSSSPGLPGVASSAPLGAALPAAKPAGAVAPLGPGQVARAAAFVQVAQVHQGVVELVRRHGERGGCAARACARRRRGCAPRSGRAPP